MPPFFGVDDAIEGFTVFEVISAIGAEVVEAITGTVAGASATVGEAFSSILGESGISSLMDFVKMGAGETVGVNVASVDELGGITLKSLLDDSALTLWEAEPEIQQITSKGFFTEKFKELAGGLIKQGVDLRNLSGRKLLEKLVLTAVKKGKAGIAIGVAGGGALAPLGIVGIVNKFKKVVKPRVQPVKDDDEAVAEIERFPKVINI